MLVRSSLSIANLLPLIALVRRAAVPEGKVWRVAQPVVARGAIDFRSFDRSLIRIL
jgi:hypothetical protein